MTFVAGHEIEDSIGPIDGFKYKEASDAFTHYENVSCLIKDNGNDTVTIRTAMAGYNIPEFLFEPDDGKQLNADDGGRFVFGSVRDLDGELLIRRVRCAFMKGTEAEAAIRNLPANITRVRLIGIPRISLKLVQWRLDHANTEQWEDTEPLTWNIPYELIVVGIVKAVDE